MTDHTDSGVTTPSILDVTVKKYASGKAVGQMRGPGEYHLKASVALERAMQPRVYLDIDRFMKLMLDGGVPHRIVVDFVESFKVSDDVWLTTRNPF